MKRLRLVPDNTNIGFISKRYIALALSACLLLGSFGLLGGKGLNLGIDFLGGILMEVKTKGPADIGALRSKIGSLGLGEVSIQEFGAPDDVLIRVQRQEGGDKQQQRAVKFISDAIVDDVVEFRRTETVGPTVGNELKQSAILAILMSIGAILLYVWFRFEWQFGLGAVIALTHDVITTLGLFALLNLEFNLASVAALLTIAGYSINDTVVIYDRVRENMRKYKKMPLTELFNKSVNETLARTVMTSVTTLLALTALLVFGGEVIRGFSIALIWGVLIGTYSSVALAVPMLLYLKVQRADDTDTAAQVTS
ncbi:protein translocase subunit SecF [Alphaproteobacteria bacterium]|jgi:preprotein translocase subunit SecF|nr:protein translocase subunit SecF [Alphaproteobacteria bacterium]